MPNSDANQPPEDPRVRFAGERTLLAWIRTGLAMMGFGFVVARFGLFLRELANTSEATSHSPRLSLWIGAGLIILGIVVNVIAAQEHHRFLRDLNAGVPYKPPRIPYSIVVAVVLAVIGMFMVCYLILLPTT